MSQRCTCVVKLVSSAKWGWTLACA